MNNSYYNVSHSRDYYKGKSVEFAGEWTSGVRYFNDEYLNSLVVYTEKDATGNIIHSALLACKKTHIAAYNNSIPDSTNNQPHLVINDNLGVIGIEPNDYWIFVSGSLVGTPGKSAEIVNTYLEALTFATESNIGKIVFVKEEKSVYLIIGAGELKKIVSTSELLKLDESKVDKELGKGLSTNDYSNTEKAKLKGIEENAQRNVIEEIDLNGVKVEPVNKVVSINVDSEVTEDSNNLVTSGAVYEKLESKQDQLIPGDNITIQNNVISATSKIDLTEYAKTEDVDKKLDTKQNTLIAGNGIKIENNKIDTTSITESETQPDTSIWVNPTENTEVELTYNRSQIDTLVGLKQDKLIAGNGIQIIDSTISSTVDTNPFIVVSKLPSVGENGKIYLTPAEKPENNNLADEWIWNNNSWERLGSASIDLSNYPKLVDLTDIINNEADNYITEARFNELKELLSTPNTIFYFNKDGMYYYSTSIDLSKISDAPSGNNYESIENIAIYFPKKQDEDGVYGYKLVLCSGFNAASYDFYWGINLTPINFSVRVYNGSGSGLVPAPAYGSTKKYLNINGQWTTVKSSELDNDSGFITASDISVKVDKEEGKGLSSNDYTDAEKSKLASLENYNDTEIKKLINQKVNDTDLAKVAKTGKYSDLIDEPLIKSSQAPTNNEPLWVNPDEDQEEVEVYNRSQVDALLNTKQGTLIPGNGIVIEGNVISSTGGGESGGSVDLSSYAKKTDVETALAGKQDTISDLDTIRANANKGATALQSYTESDPVYIADKPKIALKSEIPDISGLATKEEVAGKQDTLTPGNGISIKDNKIDVTTITESESQPSTPLWVNPSEDTKESEVTYNRSQIDALVGSKQDTISDIETIRSNAQNASDVVSSIVNAGYVFAGVATPTTDPGTPNAKVFYIANGKGTYTNFGSLEVTEDEVVVLYYDTDWHKVATGIASQAKLSELVKKNAGVNLFDESNSYAGILDKNGDITSASESYLSHSDFIEIDGNSSYFLSARLSLGGYGYLCYYDKNKALITPTIVMVGENMLLTPPANAKYLRFSFRNNYPKNQIQLNIGTKREDFREYTPIGQYCAEKIAKGVVTSEEIKAETIKYSNIEDNTILPSKTNFFNVGENIFDPNHYRNMYDIRLNEGGREDKNLEFNTSDYIPIVPNTQYYFTTLGSTIFPSVICYYNEQKEFIAIERNQRYITTTKNAVWMRISCLKEAWEHVMVVKTNSYPSTFIPFGYYLQPNLIKDDSIEISKLKQKVFPKEFGCLSNSGKIASGETLTTAKVNIKQSLLLSYHIDGTIDDIDIGVGYDGTTEEYARTNFKITSGNIIVGSNTYPLGLALGNRTDISISSKGYGSTTPVTITITNEFGDVFSQEISGIGTGTPYIKNNGDSGLNVTIKFFPRDITKKIWIFGDSYVSFVSPARWPYYLVSKGYGNFMCNSLPGARADRMIEELRNLLATGAKPTYLLWCLGMNGGGDTYSNGEFVINQMQKKSVDTVISICKENNIIPVLQTIPTVSNNGSPIYHKAYTEYIRSLGYRYVDIDNAVGSQDDGTWTAGLLDDDGVHPSVQGAKVICARFLSDFPELSIIE